jgi:hypothetical protein
LKYGFNSFPSPPPSSSSLSASPLPSPLYKLLPYGLGTCYEGIQLPQVSYIPYSIKSVFSFYASFWIFSFALFSSPLTVHFTVSYLLLTLYLDFSVMLIVFRFHKIYLMFCLLFLVPGKVLHLVFSFLEYVNHNGF